MTMRSAPADDAMSSAHSTADTLETIRSTLARAIAVQPIQPDPDLISRIAYAPDASSNAAALGLDGLTYALTCH